MIKKNPNRCDFRSISNTDCPWRKCPSAPFQVTPTHSWCQLELRTPPRTPGEPKWQAGPERSKVRTKAKQPCERLLRNNHFISLLSGVDFTLLQTEVTEKSPSTRGAAPKCILKTTAQSTIESFETHLWDPREDFCVWDPGPARVLSGSLGHKGEVSVPPPALPSPCQVRGGRRAADQWVPPMRCGGKHPLCSLLRFRGSHLCSRGQELDFLNLTG